MKTGTAPATPQDFRIPEDVFEEVFHNYLASPPWDQASWRASGQLVERQWPQRQAEVANLLTLSKITKPILEKVLYRSPYIPTVDHLCSFVTSVLKGDRRWDSLKRIPYSTPGRYVQVLDLSHLDETGERTAESVRNGERGIGSTTATGLNTLAGNGLRLNGCLNTLFPLLPHLEVLILPSSILVAPSTLRTLQYAPFRHKLKVLHGLVLTQAIEPTPFTSPLAPADGQSPLVVSTDVDSMIVFLKCFPNLRDISIKGYGDNDPGLAIWHHPQPPLPLLHLETLTLHGVKSGLLIGSLCYQPDGRVSECLPSLRNLDITSYANQPGDLTLDFLRIHGHKLRTLTLRPPTDWPPLRIAPPSETLFFCPRLQELRYLDPNTLPPIETFEDAALAFSASQHQSLRHLSISKWSTAPAFRDGPHPPSTGQFERLFETLIRNLPPNLEDVKVENFAWLRKQLGPSGMSAGVNGVCRRLSGALALRGVRFLDKDGTERPEVARMGGTSSSFGMTSMMRGLNGAVGGNIRLGMKGVGDRRRPSMDGDVDDESG